MKPKMTQKKIVPVLVTTAHRGVFFGKMDASHDTTQKTVDLVDVRNAIRWSGKNGFLGLAAAGPEPGSRIGSSAPGPITLHDVTSITLCTPAAAAVWENWK